MSNWRWALSSQIGTSHIRLGTRKQDAAKSIQVKTKQGNNILCAMVSDGAGSAEYGGQGASLACRKLTQNTINHFKSSDVLPTKDQIIEWLEDIRSLLRTAAEKRDLKIRDFACTLVFLICSDDHIIITHIGDGSIVGRDKSGDWQILSIPENGEYASTTYFLTDEPEPRIRHEEYKNSFDGFAIFTDGIEDLAIDQQSMTAYDPFFSRMIAPIDNSQNKGKDEELSLALGTFLNSDRVCEKTDDDKSLILLSAR